MPHDIFICHSAKDKPTADALCATLEAKGLRCWIAPRDVLPGADWSEAIIDAINGSRALVLVYSEHANTSPQIRREVERAVHKGLAIVPLRIEDVPMSKALEYFISTPHWLDALTPPLQRHLDYLAETLKRLIDARPGEPALAPPPVLPGKPDPIRHDTRSLVTPPKWDARTVAVAAASILAVLIVLGYFLTSKDDGLPASNAGRVSSAGPGSGVARELIGSWIAQTTVNGLPIAVETTVESDGRSKVTNTFRDYGRYISGGGRWSMVNTGGQQTSGAYAFVSDGVMSMSGPLGTALWNRDPGSPAGRSGRLSGTWSTTGTSPDGLPATTTLVFGADGTYQLIARSEETATLDARDGRWKSTSLHSGKITEGSYQVVGPDALSWSTPTGTLAFKRRSS